MEGGKESDEKLEEEYEHRGLWDESEGWSDDEDEDDGDEAEEFDDGVDDLEGDIAFVYVWIDAGQLRQRRLTDRDGGLRKEVNDPSYEEDIERAGIDYIVVDNSEAIDGLEREGLMIGWMSLYLNPAEKKVLSQPRRCSGRAWIIRNSRKNSDI